MSGFENGHGITILEKAVQSTGLVAWWTLSGVVTLPALVKAADEAGMDLDLLPAPPSAEVALHRAMKRQEDKGRKIRMLSDKKGWAIITEDEIDPQKLARRGWQQFIECEVRLGSDDELDIEPMDHVAAGQIEADFKVGLKELVSTDISSWLTEMARKFLAVRVRTTGGVYFIPPTTLPQWETLIAVLKKCSKHRMVGLPATRGEDFVAEVVEGLINEVELQAEQIEDGLSKGKYQERALRARAEELMAAEEKLQYFANLLDVSLDKIVDRLEAVQTEVSRALIAAEVVAGQEA